MKNQMSAITGYPLANKKLWATLAITLSIGLSACSSDDSHEVKAIDRVDEAAELARANAPAAEEMDFPESDVAPATTTDADGNIVAVTADTDTAVATDDSVEADMAATDSTAATTVAETETETDTAAVEPVAAE